ncbi:MAG: hypothetical protein EA388_00050 [Nitriliruptor sp.]|nr:MAG: hypothetical protein EA388_00050 [Nitriliruptor sp.]
MGDAAALMGVGGDGWPPGQISDRRPTRSLQLIRCGEGATRYVGRRSSSSGEAGEVVAAAGSAVRRVVVKGSREAR